MPKISKSGPSVLAQTTDVAGEAVHGYSFIRRDPEGSKDTYLSLLGGGSYDRNFNPFYKTAATQQYENQNFIQWFGNNAAKLGLKTATGLVGAVGGISSLAVAANPIGIHQMLAGNMSFQDFFEKNPINQFAEAANVYVDNITPAFTQDGFQQMTLGQQIQNPGDLLTSSIDSLAFMASSVLAGGLLSKLGVGTKLVSNFAKANSLESILSGAGAKNLLGKAHLIDNITAHSVLGVAESATEAADLKKSLTSKLKEERSLGKNSYSDKQIDEITDARAKNVFWMNMGTLSLTNIPFTKLFSKTFSKVPKPDINLGLRLGKDGFEKKSFTGLSKYLYAKDSGTPLFIKNVLTQVVSEGMEESMQHTIQKLNENRNKSYSLGEATFDYLKSFVDTSKEGTIAGIFQDDERLKAAGLGAIIGSGATVLSVGMGAIDKESGAYNEAKAFRNAQSSALKNLNESYTNLISGSVYKKSKDSKVELKTEDSPKGKLYKRIVDGKESEISEHDFIQEITDKSLPETGGSYTVKGKIELDENGAPILDPVKLKALQTDASTHAGIDDMFDLETVSRNDEDRLKLLQRERLATLTATAIDAGVYEELKERFETALSQDNLVEKYGMEKSEMEDHIETMKVLKNIHDNVSKDLIAFTPNDIATNEARKKLMYDVAHRVNTLNDLIKERQLKYDSIKTRQGYSVDIDALTEIEVEKARLEREIDIEFQKHSQALVTSSKASTDKLSSLLEKRSKMRDVQIPESLSVSDFKEMIKEAVKLDELIQAKNELVNEYDKYKDMHAPERMRKMKKSEWLKPYSKRVPLNIDLKNATPKVFDEFLKRKMSELAKEDRRKRASSMFYSDAIREYLFNEIIPIIDPVERHDKLLELLEEMIKNKVQVTPDLVNAMWEEFQSITTDYGLTDMELDNPYLEYENGQFVYDALWGALTKIEDSSPDLLSEDMLRVLAVDSLMDSSKSLISSFNANPEEFEDEISARMVLSQLESLEKLIDADTASVILLSSTISRLRDTIIPTATKNRENREVKNQKQVKLYASGFFPILSLDVKYPSKVIDLKENSPLEAAYAAIEHLKTLEQDEVESKLDALEESFVSKIKSLGLSSERERHLLGLVRSPEKLFKQFILWKYKSLSNSNSMPAVYKNFFKDYSIVNLLSNYESMPIEDQEMLQLYLHLTGLMDTRKAYKSTLSPLGVLQKLKEFVSNSKSSGKPAPSSAQMRAIFQLATFISSPDDAINLGSMTITLKSPAGSGKSLITIPGALHVAGIKPSEVIAVSGTKEASANIGGAIGTSAQFTVEDLIAELDNDKIDEATKVIVFDEAAAAPSVQMGKEKINAVYALSAALTRYRQRAQESGNPRHISLVLVYDPNQGVETTDAKTPFEHSYFSIPDTYALQNASSSPINSGKKVSEETIAKGEALMTDIIGSTYPYSHLLYDTLPLPVTYRSDVPEIVSLQNEFLGREDTVSNLVTVASTDPKNTTKDILGTYGEIVPDNLLTILNKSIQDNPTRSRVIVVSTSADKAKYAGLNVEVMTINEVAGLTRDEVYIDMGQYGEGSAFLNQKFYTATSRGRLFTYISGIPSTFSSSPLVKEKYEASKLTKENRHDEVTKNIDTSISLIHEALGLDVPVNEVKKTPNKKEPFKKTPDIPDDEPIKDVTRKGPQPVKSSFIATNPNNSVLNDFLQDPSWDRTAKIIRTKYENRDAYVVLVSSANSFYELEIFDQNKAEELGINLPPMQATKTRSGAWNINEELNEHNSIQVGIDPNSTTIGYRYGDEITFDFKGDVSTLISKYFSTMYPNPKESIENYDEILSNPSKFISYQAFKSDKDARTALGIRSGGVPVGQPLLVIKGVKLKNGSVLKPQYIILRTPRLTKNEEFERFHGDALIELVTKLREFTNLTKKISWNSLTNEGQAITGVGNYANMEVGMRTEVDNNNIFSPFHAFVVALSKAKSGNYSEMKLTLSEKGKVSKLNYPAIPLTEENVKILAPLMEIARQIDVLLHGDAGETDKKRLYQGRAQYAFDRIASANTFIELPSSNGQRNIKITRGIRHHKGATGVGETISGMPLLGPVGLATSSGAARMPLVSAKLRDFVRHTASERKWDNIKSIQDFISPNLSYGQNDHLVYFTLEELETVFSKEGFQHLNNGYGLNAPLSFQHLPGDSSMDFDPAGKLETTFVGVVPTTIGIILPGGKALLEEKKKKDKTTLQSYIEVKNKVSSSKDLTTEEQELFFTEYSKESGNKFKDFNEASEHYRSIGEKALTFKSQSPTSLKLLKEVYSSSKGLAVMLSEALSKATLAFSPTKNSKGTDNVQAPRDFFKSVILAIALKPRTVAEMISIAEISYKNYKVGKVSESFTQDILRFLKYKKMSIETFLGVLGETKTMLDNISLQRNLPDEAKKSIAELKFELTEKGLYDTIQSFGMYSSVLRHYTKEETVDISEEISEVESQSVFTVLDNLFTKDGNPIPSALESLEQKKKEGKTTPIEDLVLGQINREDFMDGAVGRAEVKFVFRNEKTFRSEAYLEDIDPITEKEALKIHSRFFSPSLYDRLLNIFKGKRNDPLIKIVDALRLVDSQGKNRWGIFREGITQLARQDGMVGKRVLLHEVFHQAFNNYLTPKEQAAALELARTRYGVMSDIELEERLAEDFEKYNRKAITLGGAIRSLFRKIARFFGFTYNNLHTIEALFESIHDGSYSRVINKSDAERTFDIERIFGSYQNYLYAKNAVLDRFEELLEDYPFEDAISKVFAEVKEGLEAIRLVEAKALVDPDTTEEDLSQILEKSPFTALLSPDNLQEFKNAFSPLFLSGRSRTNFKQFASFFFGNTSQVKTLASSLQESRQALLEELTEQKELLENHLNDFEGEDLESAKNQIEELKNVIGDIANETFDSELINPETKLTGIVRQRMMSVKYLGSEGVQRADLSKVFNSILPLIGGVDNSSLESIVSSVMQRIGRVLGGTPDLNTVHRSIRKASAAFIYKEFERFEALSKSRPKNVIIRQDIQSAVPYLIMSKDNSDVSLVSLSKAMSDPNYTVSFYEDGLMTEWIESVDAPIEALFYFDQSTFIKGLFGALGSLIQANPSTGIYEYRKGKYHSSYISKRKADSEAVIEGDIVEGFKDLVKRRQNENAEKLFPDLEGTTISKLNQILGSLGLTRVKRGELNEDDMASIVADFEVSLLALEAAYSVLRDGGEVNMTDVILNESSLIDALTIAAATSPTFVESTSYLRGDGKRAYIWRDASLQTSVLSSISAALKGNKSMIFPSFEIGPKGLVPKSPFLKNNLFMEGGIGKLGRAGRVIHVDHDSIKNKGRDYFSKYLHSEKTEHYLSRTFEYGFLNRFIQTKSTYFQFLPIPSNRRTINAVEVKFLSYAESIKALENIIEAQANRPDPSTNEKYNVATYVKNFDKYLLPGVTKDGKPISVKDITPAEAKKLVLTYYENQAEATLEKFKQHKSSISDSWEVPLRTWKLDLDKLSAVGKLLGVKNSDIKRDEFISGLSIASQSLRTGTPLKSSVLGLAKGEVVDIDKLEEAVEKHEKHVEQVLKEVLSVYLMNNLVNQYSLSQLLYGDLSFYKNKEDLTKRIQVHTATGDVLLVDEVEGMSSKMRVAVIDDPKVQTEVLSGMHHDSFRETYDENDGWALMLPETFARIAHARGKNMEDDVSIKPVHAEVDENGIPRLLKYSVIVLTDESIGYDENGTPINKSLHNLREAMRSSKIDQAVFASGVKAGAPISKTKYDQSNFEIYYEENGNRVTGINPASVMEIRSKFTRFQLNPAADVDKDVSNFSQITAMINSNGENTAEEYRVHSLNASLIRVGSIIASLRLGINRSGRVTARSQRHLRERILRTQEGNARSQNLINLIRSKGQNNHYNVDLALPLISNQIISSLSSIVGSSTTAIKFPGSKLVLSGAFGVLHPTEQRPLKYKDAEGYTEVILPRSYAEFLEVGDTVINDYAMGFRIPSTNYHSAIALKVVGFYDVPEGSKGNIVIAPSDIVHYMGSDYDIDSLFVVKKAKATEDIPVGDILSRLGVGIENMEQLNIKEGEYAGLRNNGELLVKTKENNEVSIVDLIEGGIVKLYSEIEDLRRGVKKSIAANEMEEMLMTLHKAHNLVTKNLIVHTISANLRDSKNRRDLLTPISFARVSKSRSEILQDFQSELRDPEFISLLIEAELLPKEKSKNVEFMANLHVEGIDLLRKPKMTELGTNLVNRYTIHREMSVLEMTVYYKKLREGMTEQQAEEYLLSTSASDLEAEVQPSGFAFDYLTQAEIHNNTYSGIKLTGVSANMAAKTLPYVFAASEVSEVEFRGRTWKFPDDYSEFVYEYGLPSIYEFLRRYPAARVTKREDPRLRKEYHVQIDSHTYTGFTRNEKNDDGTTKIVAGRPVSIYETGDTVTNLSIDNVKEQKLFLLGMTNSSANAWLTGMSMGISLNTLVLMFTTPKMKEVSSMDKLGSAKAKQTMLLNLKDENYKKHFRKLLLSYSDNVKVLSLFDKGEYEEALSLLPLKLDVLRDLHAGRLQDSTIIDYVLYDVTERLSTVGQELFRTAGALNSLKGAASDKIGIDEVVDTFDLYSEISDQNRRASSYSKNKKEILDTVKEERLKQLRETEEFKALSTPAQNALITSIQEATYSAEVDRIYDAAVSAKIISGRGSRNISASAHSVFANVAMLRIPHVYEAWAVHLKLKMLIENTFAEHSPIISGFIKNILSDVFVGVNVSNEVFSAARKDFLSYVLSDLKVQTPVGEVDSKVSSSETATAVNSSLSSTTLYGKDAWAHKFASKVSSLKRNKGLGAHNDNELLKNLEINNTPEGVKFLIFTADKSTNPEVTVRVRAAYLSLLNDDTNYETSEGNFNPREFALDLFKYGLISDNMYYERTGLSNIFPTSFAVGYSAAFRERMDLFFPKYTEGISVGNYKSNEIAENLEAMKQDFILQFARNNPKLLPSLRKPDYKSRVEEGVYVQIYQGVDANYAYDVRYPYKESNPKIITSYQGDVFVLLGHSSEFSYYRKLSTKNKVNVYESPKDPYSFERFELSKFKELNLPIVPASLLKDNTIEIPSLRDDITQDSFIYVFDYSASKPSSIRKAKVNRVFTVKNEDRIKTKLEITTVETISLVSSVSRDRKSLVNMPINYSNVKFGFKAGSAEAVKKLPSKISTGVAAVSVKDGVATTNDILLTESIYYVGRKKEDHVFIYVREQLDDFKYDVDVFDSSYDFPYKIEDGFIPKEDFDALVADDPKAKQQLEKCRRAR